MIAQLQFDFDPPIVLGNLPNTKNCLEGDRPPKQKSKLPAPRHVNRTRIAMLAAGAVFGRLTEAEQLEFDAAMGGDE